MQRFVDHDDGALNRAAARHAKLFLTQPRCAAATPPPRRRYEAANSNAWLTSASVSRSNFSPSSKVQCSIAWP